MLNDHEDDTLNVIRDKLIKEDVLRHLRESPRMTSKVITDFEDGYTTEYTLSYNWYPLLTSSALTESEVQ